MRYVDGFVLAVPEKNLTVYRNIAQKAGKIWKEHGALEYMEAVGDDLDVKQGVHKNGEAEGRRDRDLLVHRL